MNKLFLCFTVAMALVTMVWNASPSAAQRARQQEKTNSKKVDQVEKTELGNTKNVHQCGKLFLAGQFTKDDIATIGKQKISRIISLRTDGEVKWDQAAALKEAKMEYVRVPFRKPDTLTDEVFDKIRKLLSDKSKPTLFHCGSANRVGGVWLTYRVLDEGVDLKTALKEAKKVGLRTKFIEEKAVNYIKRRQAEQKKDSGKR